MTSLRSSSSNHLFKGLTRGLLPLVSYSCLFPLQHLQGQEVLSDAGLPPANVRAPFLARTGDFFKKITEGDIVNTVGVSVGSSWADYDGDGDQDLYVSNYGHNNFFYVNNGDGAFVRTTATHIIHPGASNAGHWADCDNDGDIDLIVANNGMWYDMESWFMNNGNGTFTQIVDGPLPNDGGGSQGICWADYDNDGYVDLFIPNGFLSPENNSLFHNNGDGTFTKIDTGEIVADGGTSTCAGWNDYDNDGDVDLLVTNSGTEENFFYVNNGNGIFTRDPSVSVIQDGASSYGSAWGDYDNDGDSDLYIACLGNDALFENNGDASFTQDTTSIIAHDGRNTLSGSWGDFDNDGDLDLFTANGAGENNILYSNNGDGSFTRDSNSIVSNDGGNSYQGIWGDYDNDGFLDLFVSNSRENSFLYHNNGNGNGWINVFCVGVESNRSAIGAKVRAKALIGGTPIWQLREIEGQTGFRSQNSLNVEFGFGDASIIDSLMIEWPSGIVDVYTNIGVNQFMTAIEGQAIPAVGEEEKGVPEDFALHQNYPNPFNPSTIIKYAVPQASHVTLKVYNMLGQEVATLVDAQKDAGHHEVQLTPRGKASGAYFYRMWARPLATSTGQVTLTRKILLLR